MNCKVLLSVPVLFLSQTLQKRLKFEYIQLQIFENILMGELTDVDPEQVKCVTLSAFAQQ